MPRSPVAAITILTWNLQGSHGVDVEAVASTIEDVRADIVVLQEIQRGQCRRLADRLGWDRRWAFKHFPLVKWAEGLAVLTPHPIVSDVHFALRRAWWWSWRRRIGMIVTVDGPQGIVSIANVHLSPHRELDRRRAEAAALVDRLLTGPAGGDALIAGDLNVHPDEPALSELATAGWRDAWLERWPDRDGWTNWSPGPRRGRPVDQRIDYVLVPDAWDVVEATVATDRHTSDEWSDLSDHVPLAVAVRSATTGRTDVGSPA